VSADLAAGRYRDSSIYVTPSLPRPALESLAAAAAAAGAVPRVTRLADAYASFAALAPRLAVSVGLPRSLLAFASPRAADADVRALLDGATSSLLSLCATVRACGGGFSAFSCERRALLRATGPVAPFPPRRRPALRRLLSRPAAARLR
jgi:hypothetical protein